MSSKRGKSLRNSRKPVEQEEQDIPSGRKQQQQQQQSTRTIEQDVRAAKRPVERPVEHPAEGRMTRSKSRKTNVRGGDSDEGQQSDNPPGGARTGSNTRMRNTVDATHQISDSVHQQPMDDPQFVVQSHLVNAGRRIDNANALVHDLSSYGYEADLLHRADDKLQRMARNTKAQSKSYNDYASAMVTALTPVAPGVNFTSYAWLNGDDMVNTKLSMSAKEQAIVNKRDMVVRAYSQKRDYITNATKQLDTEKDAAQAEMLAASNAEEEWAATTEQEDDTLDTGADTGATNNKGTNKGVDTGVNV